MKYQLSICSSYTLFYFIWIKWLDFVKNVEYQIHVDKPDIESNALPAASLPTLTAVIKEKSTIVNESAPVLTHIKVLSNLRTIQIRIMRD